MLKKVTSPYLITSSREGRGLPEVTSGSEYRPTPLEFVAKSFTLVTASDAARSPGSLDIIKLGIPNTSDTVGLQQRLLFACRFLIQGLEVEYLPVPQLPPLFLVKCHTP